METSAPPVEPGGPGSGRGPGPGPGPGQAQARVVRSTPVGGVQEVANP